MQKLDKTKKERERVLSPRVWSFPVRRILAGQDPLFLHDWSGKSMNERKSVLTARYSGAGICKRGGHSGGLGTGQLLAWSKVEYWIPQTFSVLSHWPLPLLSRQVQPHLNLSLSSTWLINICTKISIKQSTIGNKMSLIFVCIFRFCKSERKTNKKK